MLALVGAVLWLPLRGGTEVIGRAAAADPIPLPGHQVCADQVRISIDTDARMMRVAATIRADPQVDRVYTETKQQAYQRYEKEFADLPELQALGRPDELPASVLVVPVSGVDAHQLAARFRQEFADAKQVLPLTQADAAKAYVSIGETVPAVPCPASGEFPGH